MRRIAILAGFAVAALSPFFEQSAGQSTAATLPDSTYFRYFFIHVGRLQSEADALKVQGKEDLSVRHLLQGKAQITDIEFASLVNLAANCNAAYQASSKSGLAAAREIGQRYSGPSALPPAALQQINDLEAQRTQVITGCMANLQSQMGPARYQALRNFVVASEAPKVPGRSK